MTDEVEKSRGQFNRLLRQNAKCMDAILEILERLDGSTSNSYDVLAAGAESYTRMTKELKRLLRHWHKTSVTDATVGRKALVIKSQVQLYFITLYFYEE